MSLEEIQKFVREGYGGVLPNGNIVDRREYPAAIAIQENSLLGVPKPKVVDGKAQIKTGPVLAPGVSLGPRKRAYTRKSLADLVLEMESVGRIDRLVADAQSLDGLSSKTLNRIRRNAERRKGELRVKALIV